MQKYGVDKFDFQILANVEPEHLKDVEQQFIETLKPTYNDKNANSIDVERRKKHQQTYYSKLCYYKGETLTLRALAIRFCRMGIEHPTLEAKKYILDK